MVRIMQILGRAGRLLGYLLISPFLILIPRNSRKIVFGAWSGKQFSCNPKYLFQYLSRQADFICVWIGEEALRDEVLKTPHVVFARKGSLLAFWHCLTARFYVYNVNWREDIINFPRCRRVELIYTTHGYADKNVGIRQFSGEGAPIHPPKVFQSLRDVLNKLEDMLFGSESWCSESSEQGVEIRLSNQPFIVSRERMLRFGKPRADYFIANKGCSVEHQRQKEKIARALGIPSSKTWYVFAPTWRHDDAKVFSVASMSQRDGLVRLLERQDAIIIEKQHPIVLRRRTAPVAFKDGILVLSLEQSRLIDTQELLMSSDRLITDYSSIYYDFVLLNRPVIHFAYDYADFMDKEMGFNYDIRHYGGGPFAYSENELIAYMGMSDEELLQRRNRATLCDHLTYERGTACESYYKFLKERR